MSFCSSKTTLLRQAVTSPRRRCLFVRLGATQLSRRTNRGGPYSTRRREATRVEAAQHDAFLSLSTYSPQLFQKKHSLFEQCLVELVRRLDEAPLLQSLQVFNGFNFMHQSLAEEEMVKFGVDADVFILCQRVPQEVERGSRHPTALIAGKVGHCCEEEGFSNEGEKEPSEVERSFWGLVVKSSAFPEMQGCYLMRTTQSGRDAGCNCIHYSVTRICAGVPLGDQFDASWLV